MPSTKAKPIPPLSPKHKRDSPDRKSRKRDQSPSKISDKKRNADKEKKSKSPPPSTSMHDKKRVNSLAKQEREKLVKKDIPLPKINKLDLNKSIKQIKLDPNKPKFDKNLKRPHSSGSQKLRKIKDDKVFSPNVSKSQKAICVNTVKHWYLQGSSSNFDISLKKDQTNVDISDSEPKRSALKRMLRRQLWYVSKGVIKRNEDWSKLMEENRIDVDKINIDALDLSLIDIDALGIENKWLKQTITWFLK